MIYLPIPPNYLKQCEFADWCVEQLGTADVATWFWAGHSMTDRDEFKSVKDAIVFIDNEDAIAFKLKFGL